MVKICTEPYDKPNEAFDSWDFDLSDFQKYAIHAIQENKHVLITAHTASGKTLPAEHAINHFIKKGSLNTPGLVSSYFLILYSFCRFFLEFFRVPDAQIGYLVLQLTLGQLISIVFFFLRIKVDNFNYS